MALSMVDTEITKNYFALNVAIVGAPGTGKTTLAAALGDPGTVYFATTEMGHKYVKIRKTDIWAWSDFAGVVKDFLTTTHPYKHLVIDIFDKLYELAAKEIATRNKVADISLIPFGGGYTATKALIMEAVDALNKKGFGVTFITHDKMKEVKKESVQWTVVSSSLSDSVERAIFGCCDVVLFAHKDKDNNHMLRARPTKYIICAKDRSGKLPEIFRMDAKVILEKLNS